MDIGGKTHKGNERTHADGLPAHNRDRGGRGRAASQDSVVLDLHARLCELIPDPAERAALLRVPVTVDAAWLDGRMLPVLRAQRKMIQAAVERLERAAPTTL